MILNARHEICPGWRQQHNLVYNHVPKRLRECTAVADAGEK